MVNMTTPTDTNKVPLSLPEVVLKQQNEVARLCELLNRAIPWIEAYDCGNTPCTCEGLEELIIDIKEEIREELARFAPEPEELAIQDSRITEPEWREFTGTNEMVLKGDQEMHKTGDTEWHEVSFDVGSTARRNPKYRFRTRRPLPTTNCKQISNKLVVEPKQDVTRQYLYQNAGIGSQEMPLKDDHQWFRISMCINEMSVEIQEIRDEIQKLKAETHYHHESYCRKCNQPK